MPHVVRLWTILAVLLLSVGSANATFFDGPTGAWVAKGALGNQDCVSSQGYWKTHPDAWPVVSLALGDAGRPGHTYQQPALLALLRASKGGDASVGLAHQLIAAKLNLASGSKATYVSSYIAAADQLLGAFPGVLPYGVKPSSPSGASMTTLADVLEAYNSGRFRGACEEQDLPPNQNRPPTAKAGRDQRVAVGTIVTLNGSASADADGDRLTFLWSFVSRPTGSAALLSDAAAVTPTFRVDVGGTYELELIVSDGRATSAADRVKITTTNARPIASAGADQTVQIGDTVTLDGSGSTDVDGDALTFRWSFRARPAGSNAILSAPSAVNPSFVIDVAGDYVVQLVVNDGSTNSASDRVTITTLGNTPPVANAGPDQTVLVGATVQLDGSGSTDADGNGLTYRWSLTTLPQGSAATLSDPTAVKPTFVADLPGPYVAQLIVNDGTIDSGADTVTIGLNRPPIANAGPDQSVDRGATVPLDGSGSSDLDANALTFTWTLLSKPDESAAVLSNPTTATPTFVADKDGSYVAQLIVNDGRADSAPDTVVIATVNRPPVANAGPDQSVATGAQVQLDGSASSDPEGAALLYAWSLLSRPTDSTATLSDPAVAKPTFVADKAGDYVAQLIVGDGALVSAPDTVTITVQDGADLRVSFTLAPTTQAVGAFVALRVSVTNLGPTSVTGATVSFRVPAGYAVESTAVGSVGSYDSTTGIWTTGPIGPPFSAQITFGTRINATGPYDLTASITGSSHPDPNTANNTATVLFTPNPNADLSISFNPFNTPSGTLAYGANTGLIVNVKNDGPASAFGVAAHVQIPPGYTIASAFVPGLGSFDAATRVLTVGTLPLGGAAVFLTLTVNTAPGPLNLSATVTGSQPDPDLANNTVTAPPANRLPLPEAGPDQSVTTGTPLALDGRASSDPDGDAVTFQWDFALRPASSTATLTGANTATPSFTPDVPGVYRARLRLSDSRGTTSAADTVTITADGFSRAPIMLSSPVTVGAVGQPYAYDVNAVDQDGADTLMFSLTGAPAGMTIDPATGLIQWTPGGAQSGPQAVAVRAQDQRGLFAEQAFNVQVSSATNRAPVAADDAYEARSGEALSVNASGVLGNDTDGDGAPLTAVVRSSPVSGTVVLNPDGSFTYTPHGLREGDLVTAENINLATTIPGVVVEAPGQIQGGIPVFAADDDLSTTRRSFFVFNPFTDVVFPKDVTVTELRIVGYRDPFLAATGASEGFFQLFDASGAELFNSGVVALPPPARDARVPVPEFSQRSINIARAIPGVIYRASSNSPEVGRVFDGDVDTVWLRQFNAPLPQFVEVEFPADVTVHRVRALAPGGGLGSNIFLSIFVHAFDAAGNLLFDSGTIGVPADDPDATVELGGVAGIAGVRRVRVSGAASEPNRGANGFGEVEVIGVETSTVPVNDRVRRARFTITAAATPGAAESGFADFKIIGSTVIRREKITEPNLGQLLPTVVRAGSDGLNVPENAIDDNPRTNWYADTRDAVLELIFPVEVTVTQISTNNPSATPQGFGSSTGIDCTGHFTLHGADGSVRFDSGPVNVPLGNVNGGGAFTLPVPSVTGVQSARYTAVGCVATGFGPAFSEFRVFGSASVTTPAFGLARKFQSLAGREVHSTPLVINLTDDNFDGVIDARDIPDIVVPVESVGSQVTGEIKVISGDDGRELLTIGGPNLVSPWAEAAVGDIDGDGRPDIVAVHSDGNHLIAFDHTGAQKWISDANPMPRFDLAGGTIIGGAVAIANLDASGLPEIVVGASVFSAEGRLLGDGRTLGGTTGGTGRRSAISAIADLDLDGIPELVAGPTAYRLVNGQLTKVWQRTDLPDGYVAIGNFDDDPFPEIVIVANGRVYMLNHDGTDAEVWNAPTHEPVLLPGGGQGGAPTVADLDGDGVPEIGVAGSGNYVVFNRDGTVRWTSVISDQSSNSTGSTVFDFDGDGSVEIVYRDERFLRVYRGTDGVLLAKTPISSATWAELPVVADVDNDGHADIVVTSDVLGFGNSGATGIHVFRDVANQWARTRRIWNQHSYHVTNVNEDGTIPVVETPNWLVAGLNNFRLNAFLPGEGADGADSFTYVATDGVLESSLATVQITVRAQNSAPRITSAAITTAATGVAYVYAAQATDPDAGDVLTFSLPTAPAGMTIASASGIIRWTPTASQGGPHDVVVKVQDARGLFALQRYAIQVGAPVTIPNVVGQTQSTASSTLTGATLAVGAVTTRHSGATAAGAVISQNPVAGTQAAPGSAVALVVSLGAPPAGTVPNVVGLVQASAQIDILAAGFVIGTIGTQNSALVAAGIVLSQNPAAGTVAPGATAVNIVVSQGPSAADLDQDGDGVTPAQGDCDDANPNIRPGAVDIAGNGIDENCNGRDSIAGDDTPPTVSIDTPAEDAVITGPTDIVGTVTDANFLRYTLALAGVNEIAFRVIGSGTAPVLGAVLGRLDPTLLENGMYRVRLTAEDVNGQTSFVERVYRVTGEAKVGLLALSFIDLKVPVAGVPITVVRSYDSRVKTQRDFGVGWSLDIKTGTYQNNRRPGDGWIVSRGAGPFGLPCTDVTEPRSHFTELRLSDREFYLFRPKLTNLATLVGGCVGVVAYEFVDGSLPGATLEVLGNTEIIYTSGDQITEFDGSTDTGLVFDPRQVRLTTPDGRVIDFDRLEGVTRIQDHHANALTISASGIAHSSGKSVSFTRDAQGRITRITDPNGHRLSYGYDASSDLVDVTDQLGHRTTFTYDISHNLLEMRDPLGNRALTTEFDADGRVIAMIDARGRRFAVSHALDARQEILTDARGNVTRVTYDELGNLTSQQAPVTIDGATQIATTTFVHDRFGNEVVVVDPDGVRSEATYDHESLLEETQDPGGLGLRTAYTYDARGEPLTVTNPRGETTSVTYDFRGNPSRIANALGYATVFEHDDKGRPTQQVDASGTVSRVTYDTVGNVVRAEQLTATGEVLARRDFTYDANNNRLTETVFRTVNSVSVPLVTTYTYDARNRLTAVRDPLGQVTRTEYDALGRVAARIDALGRRTAFVYDEVGALVRTNFADGTFESREYDAVGNLTSQTDRAGGVTLFEHDELNRQIRRSLPDGSSFQTVYSPAGREIALIDGVGKRTDYTYDSAGRRIRTTLAEAVDATTGAPGRPELTQEWDEAGRLLATVDPMGNRTSYSYDLAGRRTLTTYPDGSTRAQTHDALGRVTARRDEAGRVTGFAYDALGRLSSVTDPVGNRTAYGYDEVGNVVTQTDALGRVIRYRYDLLNRLVETTLPGGQRESSVYDAVGNLLSRTRFDGSTVHFDYDVMNRLLRKRFADGTAVTFTYTPTGRRATVTDARGTTAYEYLAGDRLSRVTHPGGESVEYGFDGNGRLQRIGAPAGETTYQYDALNRLSAVVSANGVATYGYDPSGNLVALTAPNGVSSRLSFDSRRRLTGIRHGIGGTTLRSFTYQLSPTGRRLGITDGDSATETYTFDTLDRVVGEGRSGTNPRAISYDYDALGNRTRMVRDGITTTYAYDVNDRLLSAGATTYTYDANGNLASETTGAVTRTYTWDQENRLLGVGGAAGTTEFSYDADGHRVERRRGADVTRFLVDTSNLTGFAQVLEERDGAGGLRAQYVYGADLLSTSQNGATAFYQYDGLGSTRLLTDAAGAMTDTYDYDAYGGLTASTGSTANAYRFAGEQLEAASGHYNLRARNYDPATGRFLGRDPFPGTLGDPVSRHPYLYAHADPVDLVDPSGMFTLPEIFTRLGVENVLRAVNFVQRGFSVCRTLGTLDRVEELLFIGAVVVVAPNLLEAVSDAIGYQNAAFNPSFGYVLSTPFKAKVDKKGRVSRRNGGRLRVESVEFTVNYFPFPPQLGVEVVLNRSGIANLSVPLTPSASAVLQGIAGGGSGGNILLTQIERCGVQTFKAELLGRITPLTSPFVNLSVEATAFEVLKYSFPIIPPGENPQR